MRITERDYKIYLYLVANGVIQASESVPIINRNLPLKTAIKMVNKSTQTKYSVAQAVDWRYVISRGNRRHVTALLRVSPDIPRDVVPYVGKIRDHVLASCLMEFIPEALRDSEAGEVTEGNKTIIDLNALDMAIFQENYHTAEEIFLLGLRPTTAFYHFLVETSTTSETARRVVFIADLMQPDTEDLLVAVKAENLLTTKILMSQNPREIDGISLRKIQEIARKQYYDSVKKMAKILRDSINGTNSSNRGRIALLETELSTVKKNLKKNRQSSYYRGRLAEIPREIEGLKAQAEEYNQCFRKPEACRNSMVLSYPAVMKCKKIREELAKR